MRHLKAFLIAVPVAAGLLLAPSAQAEGRHRGGGHGGGHHGGGYHGGGYHGGGHGQYRPQAYRAPQRHHYYQPPRHYSHRGDDGGLAALALGLGAAAVIGGIIASSQPLQYAPPPVAYAQPGYYPNGAYIAPPGYQAPYGYVPQYGN